MRKAIKLHGKTVSAWRLGDNSDMEKRLIQEGKIKLSGGLYEIFSREAMSGSGESANAGDYFKVDSQGYPYPNNKEFFEKSTDILMETHMNSFPLRLTYGFSKTECVMRYSFCSTTKG